ncbi:hypothetical protein ANS017_07630 [Paraclostridium bifermentans]|nr:hypothetical protein ANS015_11730 [Paraclostridium bifermentans]GKZ09379.1 hypothetical protein ANS017_07630 [Paraclostridium bifermentans]
MAISKIDYVTWVKFIGKLLLILFIATLLILAIMPVVLGI